MSGAPSSSVGRYAQPHGAVADEPKRGDSCLARRARDPRDRTGCCPGAAEAAGGGRADDARGVGSDRRDLRTGATGRVSDEAVRVVLDASAVVAYAKGSVSVGEV